MKAPILVVDDDPRITDLMRRILAYKGYSVAITRSGTEALDRSLERPPDLVVLDIMLPGLDGLEVAQRLRSAGDQVPILMLTARGTVADRVKGLETGADDYLVRPFAPEQLVARIKALLRRSMRYYATPMSSWILARVQRIVAHARSNSPPPSMNYSCSS